MVGLNDSDKQVQQERWEQIGLTILSIRTKLEIISKKEYSIKQDLRKYTGITLLLEEELEEKKEHKQSLLSQIESLLYIDQQMMYTEELSEEEINKTSYLHQQDIKTICEKIKKLAEDIKKKELLYERTQERLSEIKERKI